MYVKAWWYQTQELICLGKGVTEEILLRSYDQEQFIGCGREVDCTMAEGRGCSKPKVTVYVPGLIGVFDAQ